MGQKTNPIGNRLGIMRGWESNWYGGNDYGDKLAEDDKIRKYVHARLSKASVSRVIIEHGNNGKFGETYTKPIRIKNKSIALQVYESNLNPMLKFYHIREIKPHGWIKIPAGKYVVCDVQTTSCQIDVFTRWDCVEPVQINKIAPLDERIPL